MKSDDLDIEEQWKVFRKAVGHHVFEVVSVDDEETVCRFAYYPKYDNKYVDVNTQMFNAFCYFGFVESIEIYNRVKFCHLTFLSKMLRVINYF